MTILEDRPLVAPADEPGGPTGSGPPASSGRATDAERPEDGPGVVVRAPMVAASSALSCLGAAWLVTRLFRGPLPLVVAVVAIGIGSGLVYLSTRVRQASALQYAAMPVALCLGAVLATSSAGSGTSLPSLVADTFRGGGLLEPPIPFGPGWRFLLVVLFAFLSAGSCSVANALARPKLAVAGPLPIALGAALLQPKGSEIVSSIVAIVFLVASLAVAYGAVLAGDGVVGGGFEVRRLLRGAALLVGVIVGLVALSQTSFLFPETKSDEVIPPMKPPTPPPMPDHELFTVRSDRTGPWRVGVLDVYQDNAFLLPSVDPKRVVKVPPTGELARPPGATYSAEITVMDVKGQTLVSPANPVSVRGLGSRMQLDPRTQLIKLVDTSIPRGTRYTIEAAASPEAKMLADSPEPVPAIRDAFTAMPPPPPGVAELLTAADGLATNRFDRLQYVRQALYGNVVAAGGGTPIDVPPARVDDMIKGGEATPYEISAAEVMLARWAGIPARLGFGFYGGDVKDGVVSFRPRHGAAWLEAYFEGQGWIPIIGTPPKAKPSISDKEKKDDPNVVPTDELAISVYVPVERQDLRLLFEIVRFYLVRIGPVLLALAALVIGYPAGLKVVRTGRRRRWAAARGHLPRIVVAYAQVRDRAYDLNIGDSSHTPLEFVADVAEDDEHDELAWLVTRASWGDIGRDLRLDDVEEAERMARSVLRRLDREQTGLNRLLGWTSRASLRDPWTDEIPNTWVARTWTWRPRFPRPVTRSRRVEA
jgi:hypothetical protein